MRKSLYKSGNCPLFPYLHYTKFLLFYNYIASSDLFKQYLLRRDFVHPQTTIHFAICHLNAEEPSSTAFTLHRMALSSVYSFLLHTIGFYQFNNFLIRRYPVIIFFIVNGKQIHFLIIPDCIVNDSVTIRLSHLSICVC